MPREIKAKIEGEVISIDPEHIHWVVRDQYLHYWHWLLEIQHCYNLFFFTDSKDVIFQRDIPKISTRKVFLTEEGMTHGQCQWNTNDQMQAQIDVKDYQIAPFDDKPVINGGILWGNGSGLRELFFLLWAATIKSSGKCTEQGVLNYLYNYLSFDHRYKTIHPESKYGCLTGTGVLCNQVPFVFEKWDL